MDLKNLINLYYGLIGSRKVQKIHNQVFKDSTKTKIETYLEFQFGRIPTMMEMYISMEVWKI